MGLSLNDIHRVKIEDDDMGARQGIAFGVEDADLTPLSVDGPLPNIDQFVQEAVASADAVICDHHLKQGTYACFNGAQAVALFYRKQFPALLCTAWSKADIDEIRRYRREIPSLIPANPDPDLIIRGFEVCIDEYKGKFLPGREPVKTIVRIEDIGHEQKAGFVYAVVPGWNSREVVRFSLDIVSKSLREHVKPDVRFYAKVNIGAEDQADLYFYDFEFRG